MSDEETIANLKAERDRLYGARDMLRSDRDRLATSETELKERLTTALAERDEARRQLGRVDAMVRDIKRAMAWDSCQDPAWAIINAAIVGYEGTPGTPPEADRG